MKKNKHLLIPDAHATPKDNFRRFEWLGELIMMEMPDVIIDIGDWWDMASLCSYDKGTKSFEGRRYNDDIEAGHIAAELAFGPIVKYNNTRTRHKKGKYNPRIVRTLGNHEHRIHRCIEREPVLDGRIGFEDLECRLPDLSLEVHPFLDTVIIDGVCYSHYFVSGVMGRPVPSARSLISKHHISCTMGHTHTRDWAEGVRADGLRIQGLVCGAFHDIDHHSSFASGQAQDQWWNGLHIKNDVYNGDYDRSEISIQRLQKMMEG